MNDFPLPLLLAVLLIGIGCIPVFGIALGLQFRYLRNLGFVARTTWPRLMGLLALWLTVALVVTVVVFTVMPPRFLTVYDRLSPPVIQVLAILLFPSSVGAAVAIGVTTWMAKRVGRGLTSA